MSSSCERREGKACCVHVTKTVRERNLYVVEHHCCWCGTRQTYYVRAKLPPGQVNSYPIFSGPRTSTHGKARPTVA